MGNRYYTEEEQGYCSRCGQALHPDGCCMECDFVDEGGEL